MASNVTTATGETAAPPWTRLGQQDLTAWYEEALAGPRVRYLEELGVWAVFRYADVDTILHDDVNWSTGRRLENMPAELRPYNLVADTVVGSDPPDHTRLRRLVTPAFRPALIRGLRERATVISGRLLDAALAKGSVEFVSEYGRQLPSTMIAELPVCLRIVSPGSWSSWSAWSNSPLRIQRMLRRARRRHRLSDRHPPAGPSRSSSSRDKSGTVSGGR